MSICDAPCDLCGCDSALTLFERGSNKEEVRNVVCEQCGLVYVNPRSEKAVIEDRYTSSQFSVEARGSLMPSSAKFAQSEWLALQRFLRITKRYPQLKDVPGAGLEIGCGFGSFLRLLRGLGWSVSGIEPDSIYAKAGFDTYGIDIESTIYEEKLNPEKSFNLIAAFHVLEHVVSPTQFLEKANAELMQGGLLYLEVPCIEKPYGGDLENFFWSAHIYSFSRNTLSAFLEKAGFAIVHTEYVGYFLEIVARKGRVTSYVSSFPVDNPRQVVNSTLNAYHRYKLFNKKPLLSMLPLIGRSCKKTAAVFKEDPHELRAIAKRELRARFFPLQKNSAVSSIKRFVRGPYVTHYGMHVVGNAGDVLLFEAVRRAFQTQLGVRHWSLEPLWSSVTPKDVERINRNGRGIVVGGGGLLLRDTNPNGNSGWQWNCPTSLIAEFRVPLVVYAIGYNRFRDQEDFTPIFRENINLVVEKSAFFGLRNLGRIESLKPYLRIELQSKLRFQPCPTTVLSHLYPRYQSRLSRNYNRRLALNLAFDRHRLRFKGNENIILDRIARAMRMATDQGWKICVAVHVRNDMTIVPWLYRHRVPFSITRLDGRLASEILSFYSEIALTVGMRGHSQMIPFGLGNAIISLVSHDKLGFFLQDIGHPEWGLDVADPDLTEQLVSSIQKIGDNLASVHEQLQEAQNKLWGITRMNFQEVREAL